jgi:hypothetical protein
MQKEERENLAAQHGEDTYSDSLEGWSSPELTSIVTPPYASLQQVHSRGRLEKKVKPRWAEGPSCSIGSLDVESSHASGPCARAVRQAHCSLLAPAPLTQKRSLVQAPSVSHEFCVRTWWKFGNSE